MHTDRHVFRFATAPIHYSHSCMPNETSPPSQSHAAKNELRCVPLGRSGSVIQNLSGSWCIKGADDSTLVMDSPVPLMHHESDKLILIQIIPKERSLKSTKLSSLAAIVPQSNCTELCLSTGIEVIYCDLLSRHN